MNRVTLEQLKGHPVRLMTRGGSSKAYHGILAEIRDDELAVDLLDAPRGRQAGGFSVEIMDSNAMIRFTTMGETDWIQDSRITLDMPEQMEVVQRREFPRAPVSLPVWVRSVGPHEDPTQILWEPPSEPPHGKTINLSGGGVALISNQLVYAGQQVMLTIDTRRGAFIAGILADVLRYGPGSGGGWFAALRFLDPSLEVQAAIGQLVLAEVQVASSRHYYGKIFPAK